MDTTKEIDLDCQELERLSALTTRESVRNLLSQQIQSLKVKCQEQPSTDERGDAQAAGGASSSAEDPAVPTSSTVGAESVPKPSESQKVFVSKLPTKKITSYGWDQSPKFTKVYVTLTGVHLLTRQDVTIEFTSSSVTLKVKKSDCIHELIINSLLQQIIPDKSHHKVKTDSVVLFLKKGEEKNWEYLTQTEKKAKQKSKPAAPPKTDSADPSASIMGLMKQMYDDGDDDMKRTIAQAWTQAREKKDTMELP